MAFVSGFFVCLFICVLDPHISNHKFLLLYHKRTNTPQADMHQLFGTAFDEFAVAKWNDIKNNALCIKDFG